MEHLAQALPQGGEGGRRLGRQPSHQENRKLIWQIKKLRQVSRGSGCDSRSVSVLLQDNKAQADVNVTRDSPTSHIRQIPGGQGSDPYRKGMRVSWDYISLVLSGPVLSSPASRWLPVQIPYCQTPAHSSSGAPAPDHHHFTSHLPGGGGGGVCTSDLLDLRTKMELASLR